MTISENYLGLDLPLLTKGSLYVYTGGGWLILSNDHWHGTLKQNGLFMLLSYSLHNEPPAYIRAQILVNGRVCTVSFTRYCLSSLIKVENETDLSKLR